MSISFSQAGWYRIAKYEGNINLVRGASGNSTMLTIKAFYNYVGNVTIVALLNSAFMSSNIIVLGTSNHRGYNVSRLRHTIDSNDSCAYLEVYYATDYPNGCKFELTHAECGVNIKWQLIEPEPTQETVSGVEVYSSANLESEDRQVMTKSDIPNLFYYVEDFTAINNPIQAIKNKWNTMPDGYYLCNINVSSVCLALVQHINNGKYGSVFITSYISETPIYMYYKFESGWSVTE